ncbi:hypothetical protein A3L12_08050 [Thermococcus sp. P6]|nr:hypothetical protein A3L12_08050 [Thermococcus sp. P6]
MAYHHFGENREETGPSTIIPVPDSLQDILVDSPQGRELIREGKKFEVGPKVISWYRGDPPNITYTRAKAIVWIGGKWVIRNNSTYYEGGEPYIVEFDLINRRVISMKKTDEKDLQAYYDEYYRYCGKTCEELKGHDVIVTVKKG